MRGYSLTQFLLITGWYLQVSLYPIELLGLPKFLNPLIYLFEGFDRTNNFDAINLTFNVLLPTYAAFYLIPLAIAVLRDNPRETPFQSKINSLGWFFSLSFALGLIITITNYYFVMGQFDREPAMNSIFGISSFLNIVLFFFQVWIFVTIAPTTPAISRFRMFGFAGITWYVIGAALSVILFPLWFSLDAMDLAIRLGWYNMITFTISVVLSYFLIFWLRQAMRSDIILINNQQPFPNKDYTF